MSITKKYLQNKGVCKVTFTLPPGLSEKAKRANVVGEFNNWNPEEHPMKKRKNGQFALSMELQSNNEYQFRYLVDGVTWETDMEADALASTPFEEEYNSVVKV